MLGLFTPLAAAAALAYLINALLASVAAQPDAGYFPFFLPDGHEYQVTLIVVAAALTLTGPGRYGFDAGRGWARRPFIGSFVALVVGIGRGHRRLGVPQRHQPAGLATYGLGTRPSVAAVSCGSVAKVTAGSRNSEPSVTARRAPTNSRRIAVRRCRTRHRPAAQQRARGHGVPVGDRAVADDGHRRGDRQDQQRGEPRRLGQHQRQQSEGEEPDREMGHRRNLDDDRVPAPEADDELTTSILALAACRLIPAHRPRRPAAVGNLTFDLCGGYRRLLCSPRDRS